MVSFTPSKPDTTQCPSGLSSCQSDRGDRGLLLGVMQSVQCCSPLPACCPELTGATAWCGSSRSPLPLSLGVPAGDGGMGARGSQEPSLDALRRRNIHVCFSRVTSWQNTAVGEGHQCEGNGGGVQGWVQEEAPGKTGGFLREQE